MSLRTKDPSVAKDRFADAARALLAHFDATRQGPRALTHRQIVALAGDAYRASVKHYEDESDYVPDGYLREKREFEESIAEFRYDPDDGAGVLGDEDAYMVTAMARPFGVPRLILESGRDQHIFDWATSRVESYGIDPATVKRNDIVAVSSVFGWPMTPSGQSSRSC